LKDWNQGEDGFEAEAGEVGEDSHALGSGHRRGAVNALGRVSQIKIVDFLDQFLLFIEQKSAQNSVVSVSFG